MNQVTVTVHTIEQTNLAKAIAKQFGYYLLLLGEADYQKVSTSPIAHHIVVAKKLIDMMSVVDSLWQQLPFADDSIDVLVLSHALEMASAPETLLLECKRVLRHDGRLIILGTNPWRDVFNVSFKLMPMMALKQQLRALNFTCIESKRFNFFSRILLTTIFEKIFSRCFPFLCRSYLLVVKKQVMTLTPLKMSHWFYPFWKKTVVPVASNVHRRDHG